MTNPEELKLRLSNVVRAVAASMGRAKVALSFGSAEELEEIGLLTMRLAALEESIALYSEILLIRPELGGFHASTKSMLTRQLSEKLNIYKMLITASGMLYSIDIKPVEQNIATVKAMGEDRNTIIHGMLAAGSNSEVMFHGRGGPIRATVAELRSLTEKCQKATVENTTVFSVFYTELVGRKSTHAAVEAAVQIVLASSLPFLDSSSKSRQSTLTFRESELTLHKAQLELSKAREKMAQSKKALRNAKERLRRSQKASGNVGRV